jgi:hypothetical protein
MPAVLDEALIDRVLVRLATRPHQGGWRDQKGAIIDAALVVLADGHPRTGDDIWTEARKRGLLTHTQEKDVYVALVSYIERHSGAGRWSVIVQDVDRRFRLNHPIDDWPDPKSPLPARPSVPDFDARKRELESTQRGPDAAAFETAVCNAFVALGFRATHVGGNGAPDGYIDAPLGPLGYRAMLECKRAKIHWVLDPDANEAARYRKPFGAQYATLIGPDFAQDVALRDELLNHEVSCWTTADLIQCLEGAYDPVEMQALFAPGFVRQHIDDIAWERAHGFAKRVAVVSDILRANATRVQTATVAHPTDAPRLDENAALLMVDAALTAVDAHRPCTVADVLGAFRHLTDPLVGEAVYADEAQTAIVFRRLSNA